LIGKGKDERQNRDCHCETVAHVRRSSLLHSKLSFKFSVNHDAAKLIFKCLASEWPLPICDVLTINTELVGVALGRYLLVEQGLANAGCRDLEARHPVDGVNC
jgi:hypothetical protein